MCSLRARLPSIIVVCIFAGVGLMRERSAPDHQPIGEAMFDSCPEDFVAAVPSKPTGQEHKASECSACCVPWRIIRCQRLVEAMCHVTLIRSNVSRCVLTLILGQIREALKKRVGIPRSAEAAA